MNPENDQRPRPRWLSIAGRIAGLLLVVAISAAVFALSDQIKKLQTFGYLGAFVVMLVGNATIILPAPGLTIVFALGSVLNPVLVGLAAGAGAALGELTGYLAGFSGRAAIENYAIYRRFERWMQRHGLFALLVLATIPNPFFDIAGVIAGALRFAWWRFLLVAWCGKTAQGILVALAGNASAYWVLELVK